ncbi:aminotransferase class IV [Peptoniphilus sp. AGMB00490]|uniref:Aminotransferase class IV n=1 Tax=Peptoniphilus faecalis TaxID=2731255 RepID=A0A848RHY2_9FIRM|nr:aminotransferase class IV [Peptoniphilus faecalis]NMW84846.1 aminotransferase class IV [Peptoniphilus faecalis]
MKIEFDDGFSFGKGVFETIKVVDGMPLFLEDHLKRLKNSLDFFEIKTDIDEKKIYEYIDKSNNKNFAMKVIISDKNFIVTSREDNYRNDNKSYKLKISKVKRNSTSKIIYHKSLSYYENILEHGLAVGGGYDSALFLNEREEISETSFANIFFVKNDKIYTPTVSSGLLRGTMRGFLIKNFEIIEDKIYAKNLDSFDECFISNSLMGVRNVVSIDEIKFNRNVKTKIIQDYLKKFGF